MGSLASMGLGSLGADTALEAAGVALTTIQDPYLPELLCRMKQLAAIEKKQTLPACQAQPLTLRGGIGLRNAMLPMRGYVYAQQHKWAYAVAAIGLIGLPILVGYQIGKHTRSK